MGWVACLKPGASIRTHLFTASLMWSFIGVYLMLRGYAVLAAESGLLFLGALGAGALKSRLILDRAAGKNVARVRGKHDGSCLGGVYSWRMWGLVACMMLGGRVLRLHFGASLPVGALYVAVGFALLLSSRLIWRQWHLEKNRARQKRVY